MKDMAVTAFNRAVAAADSSSAVAGTLQTFAHRRDMLHQYWGLSLQETLKIRLRNRTDPGGAAADMKFAGFTPEILDSYIAEQLHIWRANWAELCSDAMELFIMVDAEARVAEVAMARYNAKVKKLKEGKSSIGRIAGYAAEQDRLWQTYDRMTERPAPGRPEEAVQDPARYARKQRDAAATMAGRLARGCDVVMSDAVENPDALRAQLTSLALLPAL